jgi:predicted anti-sigma-YlaC factor YlaD
VALGVGFLIAAVHPHLAPGMRPIVATAALLLAGSAAVDLLRRRMTVTDGVPCLIAAAGWLLVMFLARRSPDIGATQPALRRWTTQVMRSMDRDGRRRATRWGDGRAPVAVRSRRPSSACAGSSWRPPPGGRHRPR